MRETGTRISKDRERSWHAKTSRGYQAHTRTGFKPPVILKQKFVYLVPNFLQRWRDCCTQPSTSLALEGGQT